MKKKLNVIAGLLVCLALVFSLLSGCSDTGSEDQSGSQESKDDWIVELFTKAEFTYSWFTGCGQPATNDEDVKYDGENAYVRVTESGVSDLAALRQRLADSFTETTVNSLMSTEVFAGMPLFRDFDGALYVFGDIVGAVPHDIGDRVGTVTSQTENEISYHVDMTYEYYDTEYSAQYDYKLTLGEDGVWRFSHFQLPALLIAEEMFDYEEEVTDEE